MNPRFLLIALLFAMFVSPSPAHAVKRWRTEFHTPIDHSISLSRSLKRRQLRSEKLALMPSSGPIRSFNQRNSDLKIYRDHPTFRGGRRSPRNPLQRAHYTRS